MRVRIPLPLLFLGKLFSNLFVNFNKRRKDIYNNFVYNFLLKYSYRFFNYFYKIWFKKDYTFLHIDLNHIDQNLKEENLYYSQIWYINNMRAYKFLCNRDFWQNIFLTHNLWTDRWLLNLLKHQYNFFIQDNYRYVYRLNFFKNGFYSLFSLKNPKSYASLNLKFFMSGWRYFLKFFSKWFLPLVLVITYVYYSMVMQALPAARVAFVWISVFSAIYLLVSGFVFFFKKYQYGKFTSVIQRFWKRSLILFWLIEGGLLIVFFYLTINSTWYLYNLSDQSQLFRNFLFSWRLFLLKLIPLTLLLLLTFIFLINNKWQTLTKNSLLIVIITSLVIFITWIEFYQFYHIINYHHGKTWVFSKIELDWVVETDLRKTLATKSFVNVMLILKFWHVLFVAGMWIFFVLRSNESERIRYPLIAGNFLNFVMLYILSWIYMYPWFRLVSRQYFSYTYKWFYLNNRSLPIRLFFNDLQLFLISFCDYKFLMYHYFNLSSFKYMDFFYFKSSGRSVGFVDFNKRFNSNQVIADFMHHTTKSNKSHDMYYILTKCCADMCRVFLVKILEIFRWLSLDNYLTFGSDKGLNGLYEIVDEFKLNNLEIRRFNKFKPYIRTNKNPSVDELFFTSIDDFSTEFFNPIVFVNLYEPGAGLLIFTN